MYETIAVEIKGIAPLIMHNGQLADPLNEHVKKIKELTSNRQKTDSDHELIGRAEWMGGLYTNHDRRIIVPGETIESMLAEAGKKKKLGKHFKSGVLCDGDFPLIYNGPKDIDALYDSGNFIDRRLCKVQTSRIMRTRPIFRDWGVKFDISYLPDVLNEKDVRDVLVIAGRLIGLMDFRPKFGRFEVV